MSAKSIEFIGLKPSSSSEKTQVYMHEFEPLFQVVDGGHAQVTLGAEYHSILPGHIQ